MAGIVYNIAMLAREANNYKTWSIDMEALLRRQGLWEFVTTERPYLPDSVWSGKVNEAADTMAPFISDDIKIDLDPADFDDGYHLFENIEEMFEPAIDDKIFSADYEDQQLKDLIGHINATNAHIDATKMELTSEKRALFFLSMALMTHPPYSALTRTWARMESLTFDQACSMLHEEKRRQIKEKYKEVRGSDTTS